MEPGGSKRGFGGWLRVLGIQNAQPPPHSLVTLVGDERELTAAFPGPRGIASIDANDTVNMWQVLAGPNGTWLTFEANSDGSPGAPTETMWGRYETAAEFFKIAPGFLDPANAATSTISWADPALVGGTQVCCGAISGGFAALSVRAQNPWPINPFTSVLDAWHARVGGFSLTGNLAPVRRRRWWIAPGVCLSFAHESSAVEAGIEVQEPASPRNG